LGGGGQLPDVRKSCGTDLRRPNAYPDRMNIMPSSRRPPLHASAAAAAAAATRTCQEILRDMRDCYVDKSILPGAWRITI